MSSILDHIGWKIHNIQLFDYNFQQQLTISDVRYIMLQIIYNTAGEWAELLAEACVVNCALVDLT